MLHLVILGVLKMVVLLVTTGHHRFCLLHPLAPHIPFVQPDDLDTRQPDVHCARIRRGLDDAVNAERHAATRRVFGKQLQDPKHFVVV